MQVKALPTSFDEYVNFQREFNALHTDGRSEAFVEDAFFHVETMLELLLRYRAIPNINRVLFAGCRTGYEIRFFQEKRPRVETVGIDIVPEFVEVASSVTDTHVMDMHYLTFMDKEFDLVFSSQALEHCYDVQKALSELLRVAAKYVYVSVPLELNKTFVDNKSHYTASVCALDWLELLRPHDEWVLQHAELVAPNVLDFLAVRQ